MNTGFLLPAGRSLKCKNSLFHFQAGTRAKHSFFGEPDMGFKEFNSLCDKDRSWLERLCQQREWGGWEETVGAAAVTRV